MNTPCENTQKTDNHPSPNNENHDYSLEDLILRIKSQFDVNDIEDYKDIIFIIYNSLFLDEDKIDTREKLRIFSLIETAVTQISNSPSKNCHSNKSNNTLSYDEMYNVLIPYHMQKTMDLMYRGFRKDRHDVPNIPPFL